MQPPIAPPEATQIHKFCSECGASETATVCSQCGANLSPRRHSRNWFFAALGLGVVGAIAALVGDTLFRLRSRGLDGSLEVVEVAGNWAALGFFGGFLLLVAIFIFLMACFFWMQERKKQSV